MPRAATTPSPRRAATPATAGRPAAAEEDAFPATLTHKYGETTVEKAPARVVCVGLTDQDALIALGIAPVAISYWFGDEGAKGVYSWAQEAFGDAELPTVLQSADGIPVEEVAALAPDLIVGLYSGMTQKEYDLLSKIAPTVAQPGEYADYGVPWDEGTLTIGTAIGKPAAAQELIDSVKARITEEKDAHPQFAGQTAAVVTPYEGLFIYGPRGPALADAGRPRLRPAADDHGGRRQRVRHLLSSERTSDLADVGAVVWLDLSADKQVEKVFQGTTAYDEGRWFDINDEADGDYYVAHSFVTPLSIPYVLDRYVPQLAAAADGDPATEVPGSDI